MENSKLIFEKVLSERKHIMEDSNLPLIFFLRDILF
jgi:hypothetical protein